MGQKDGEKWTAAVDLQPTIRKSDRLLDLPAWQRCTLAARARLLAQEDLTSRLLGFVAKKTLKS